MSSAVATAIGREQPWLRVMNANPSTAVQGCERFVVAYFIQGSAQASFKESQLTLGNEDMLILSTDIAGQIAVPPGGRCIELRFPPAPFAVANVLSSSPFVVETAPGGTPTILGYLLRGLSTDVQSRPTRISGMAHQVAQLTAAHCAQLPSRQVTEFESATLLIDSLLWDEALCPSVLSARLHVSVRTLHRTFKARGTTIAAWIREQRLQKIRLDLCDPDLEHLSARAIGARWGLHDPTHLSRLFRSAFGTSPAEWRAQVRIGTQVQS